MSQAEEESSGQSKECVAISCLPYPPLNVQDEHQELLFA